MNQKLDQSVFEHMPDWAQWAALQPEGKVALSDRPMTVKNGNWWEMSEDAQWFIQEWPPQAGLHLPHRHRKHGGRNRHAAPRDKTRSAGTAAGGNEMKPILITALLCLLLTGCQREQYSPSPAEVLTTKHTARFQVVRVATFEDRLAYGNTRGIYIIRDLQSGEEYIGVSGVGISELGSHPKNTGKRRRTVSDER